METLVFNTKEFRESIGKAFTHVENGGEVIIIRRGKAFTVKLGKLEVTA